MKTADIPTTTSTAAPASNEPWRSFKVGEWTESVNVRDFIQGNYQPYDGE